MLVVADNGQMPDVCGQNGIKDTQEHAMIPTAYSEGVSLCSTGTPCTQMSYKTECLYLQGVTYRTSVSFLTKFVPEHFTTTLVVDKQEPEQQFVPSYNVIPFFVRRTVPVDLTITEDFSLVKSDHTITTTLKHDPDFKYIRFVSGVDLDVKEREEVIIQLNPENVIPSRQDALCNGDDLHAMPGPCVNGTTDAK